MARGRGLRKALTLGLFVGAGIAAVRASRARRLAQTGAAPPAWPPLPNALVNPPPGRPAEPAAEMIPGGPPELVAEAAVLEAAGITEAAEVDEAVVTAWRASPAGDRSAGSSPPPGFVDDLEAWPPPNPESVLEGWGPPPEEAFDETGETGWASDLLDEAAGTAPPAPLEVVAADPPADLDAIILAEEAALEAERLEAERLELARLQAARLKAEDDPQARRRRERDDALARFAAQRKEAETLLAAQTERASAAQGVARGESGAGSGMGERHPIMAADLPGGRRYDDGDDDGEDDGEADPQDTVLSGHATPHEETGAAPPGVAPEDVDPVGQIDDRMWPEGVRELERTARVVEEDELAEPTLEPLVPDEAVADLDEEPKWASLGVEPVAPEPSAPEPTPAAVGFAPQDDEHDLGPATSATPEPDLTLPAPDDLDDLDDLDGLELDVDFGDRTTRRPLMAADLEPGLGEVAPAWTALDDDDDDEYDHDDDGEPDEAVEPAVETANGPAAETAFAHASIPFNKPGRHDPQLEEALETNALDFDEELELADEPEPELLWEPAEAEDWQSDDASSGAGRRRPLMTDDFDDILPEDLEDLDDLDDLGGLHGSGRTEGPESTDEAGLAGAGTYELAGETVGRESIAEEGATAAVPSVRRSGRPRVPLRARDVPGADATTPQDSPPPVPAPAPASEPAETAVRPAEVTGTMATQAPSAKGPKKVTRAPARTGTAKKAVKKVMATKAAAPEPTVGGTALRPTVKKAAASAPAAAPDARKVSSRRRKPALLWVEPVGSTCPTGYPVKASLASGIFHVVGGLFYDRSNPDRCYRNPAAAEADGLRQAKR